MTDLNQSADVMADVQLKAALEDTLEATFANRWMMAAKAFLDPVATSSKVATFKGQVAEVDNFLKAFHTFFERLLADELSLVAEHVEQWPVADARSLAAAVFDQRARMMAGKTSDEWVARLIEPLRTRAGGSETSGYISLLEDGGKSLDVIMDSVRFWSRKALRERIRQEAAQRRLEKLTEDAHRAGIRASGATTKMVRQGWMTLLVAVVAAAATVFTVFVYRSQLRVAEEQTQYLQSQATYAKEQAEYARQQLLLGKCSANQAVPVVLPGVNCQTGTQDAPPSSAPGQGPVRSASSMPVGSSTTAR